MKTIPAGKWKAAAPIRIRETITQSGSTRVILCELHPDAKLFFEDVSGDPYCLGALRCPSCDAGETPRRRASDRA